MDRSHVAVALLALLGVLALSVGAASLDAATSAGSGAGTGDDDEVGPGEGDRFDLGSPNFSQGDGRTFSFPPYVLQAAMLVLFVLSLLGLVVFYLEYGLRGVVAAIALVVGVSVVLFLVISHIDFAGLLGELQGQGGLFGSGEPELPGGGASGDADETTPVADGTIALAVLLAAVVAGAALVIFRASGDAAVGVRDADLGEATPAALGRAAGRAADRIEAGGVAVDNEVYRAWREMTDHLDVANPAAATPAEFADAAVAAGMDRGDVAELTALFEEVRYGDASPTESREERALAALRRIEGAYAPGESDQAGAAGREDGTGGFPEGS